MSDAFFVYAGSASDEGGLFRHRIGTSSWEKLPLGVDAKVRCVAIHPRQPKTLLAGTHVGPFLSLDGGEHWTAGAMPGGAAAIWSILFDPRTPDLVYAGAGPTAIHASTDGGRSWGRGDGAVIAERCRMPFTPRVTRLAASSSDLYATVEVGGFLHSSDGGSTWVDRSTDLLRLAELPHLKSKIGSDNEAEGMLDAHSVCAPSTRAGTVFYATRMGVFRSDDRGVTWRDLAIARFSPLTYARDVQASPHDPDVLYVSLSRSSEGDTGSIYRSVDLGDTWERFDHGITPRCTMMVLGQSAASRDRVVGGTLRGQVFSTLDGGRSWAELPPVPGARDLRAVLCT